MIMSATLKKPASSTAGNTACSPPGDRVSEPFQWPTWMFFAPVISRQEAKILIMVVSKASDHIQMKIKMPKPIQEPPKLKAQAKAKSQD